MILTEDEKRELYTKWCCYPSELVNQTEKLILSKIGDPIAWWNGKETAFFEHEFEGKLPEPWTIPLYKLPEVKE